MSVAPPADRRTTLARSPLVAAGGLLFADLLSFADHRRLLAEAMMHETLADTVQIVDPPGDGELRGQPDRWLDTAVGGPVLASFFTSPRVMATLAAVTGLRWESLGSQGIFSYYRRPGHALGVHRDAPDCTLAVITCLLDGGDGSGGELVVYPGRAGETMAGIRRDPTAGALPVRIEPGRSAILLGSMVPHRVTPIEGNRSRIVTPLCYQTFRGG